MNRQTTLAKPETVQPKWYVVDATDQVLGRLSTRLATVLMGKHKPDYTPHVSTGDFVIVLNADKIKVTGNKLDQKFQESYSGHPSGRKLYSFRWLMENNPEALIEESVRRMLPKNKLASTMLKKLKVYAGDEHPHQPQNPEALPV